MKYIGSSKNYIGRDLGYGVYVLGKNEDAVGNLMTVEGADFSWNDKEKEAAEYLKEHGVVYGLKTVGTQYAVHLAVVEENVFKAIMLNQLYYTIKDFNNKSAEKAVKIVGIDRNYLQTDALINVEIKDNTYGWVSNNILLSMLMDAVREKKCYVVNPSFLNRYTEQKWYIEAKNKAYKNVIDAEI